MLRWKTGRSKRWIRCWLQSDPITRVMLIEQALRLHRQSMEARDLESADTCATTGLAEPRPRC
jgi:hypothetical protein